MRTVPIPEESLSKLAWRYISMNPRTIKYESYICQPRGYAGGEDPFLFVPYGSSGFKCLVMTTEMLWVRRIRSHLEDQEK